MNGDDVKWLKELFDQHKKDQEKYLDSKFESLATKIDEVKNSVDDLQDEIEDVEVACVECIDDLEERQNKRIVIGSGTAVVVALAAWTIFGTDAIKIILGFFGKMFVGG